MRILFLTQVIPYPPDAGPKVKTWHVLKYLATMDHEITLVSFLRAEEERFLPGIADFFAEVHVVPIRRSRMRDAFYWLRGLIRGTPFLIERDDVKSMRILVHHLLQTRKFDVVHADQITMAQFALPSHLRTGGRDTANAKQPQLTSENGLAANRNPKEPTFVFDAHNAMWTIMRRMEDASQPMLKPFLSLEAKRMQQYEGMIVHSYSHTLAVSENDRLALSEAERAYCNTHGGNSREAKDIHLLPIAVDIGNGRVYRSGPSRKSILILGTLHYPPNADGVRWFVRDIFPQVQAKIPGTSVTVVGKNPPSDLIEMEASQPEVVKVTGYVSDLGPYLEAADVMVVPVRVGGGMRVRILEGFSWGMPLVTTTVGLEGIEAIPGRDILVADDDRDFIDAVCSLLNSESERSRLSKNGRELVKRKYDWRVVLKKLDEIYV